MNDLHHRSSWADILPEISCCCSKKRGELQSLEQKDMEKLNKRLEELNAWDLEKDKKV